MSMETSAKFSVDMISAEGVFTQVFCWAVPSLIFALAYTSMGGPFRLAAHVFPTIPGHKTLALQ